MGAPASPRGIVWRKQMETLEERVRQANPRYGRAGAIRAANERLAERFPGAEPLRTSTVSDWFRGSVPADFITAWTLISVLIRLELGARAPDEDSGPGRAWWVRQQALWHGRWESAREILPPVKAAGRGQMAVYGDQVLHLPPDPPDPVQCALPPDTLAFTGRDQELSRITAAVVDAAAVGGVVAIHAIDGMPGVGKTALAIHAAHYLADRFPDGQLFLDLHAHTPGQVPTDSGAALAALLAADGVDPRYLPDTLDERAVRWRSRLASKKVLLILDNAASSDQIRPLLPGRQTCTVLITSRRHLGDLPGKAEVIALNVLAPPQAKAMFLRLAPRAGTDNTAMVEDLVAVAGYFPLAVSLLAKLYTKHPAWTLNDLLAECRTRLLSVTAEHATIAAAYDLSYQYLPDARQRFYRCLGAHPGAELDPYAAAALAGVPLAEAIAHLDALFGDSLLAEIGYRRYAMHDLIRQYARDLAAADPPAHQEQAIERLLDYYQRTARTAAANLARQTLPSQTRIAPAVAAETGLPEVSGYSQALAWMRTERANLLACLARTRDSRRLVALTSGLAELLRLDGPWNEAVVLHSAAAQAAMQAGDQLGQANALNHLGEAQRLTDDYPGAEQTLHTALSLYRNLGNRLGQANVLDNLGLVRQHIGDYPGAVNAMQQALDMHRDLGDRLGGAYSLLNIGGVRRLSGDFPGAVQALLEALDFYRSLGNRLGEATALNSVGIVRRVAGDIPAAAQALQEALDLCQDLGNRLGQAYALINLGIVWRVAGDIPAAAQALQEALDLCRDLGDAVGEANALIYLGVVWRTVGDFPAAAQALQEAVALYRSLSDRGGEVEALNETGTLHRITGDLDNARLYHQQALDLALQIRSPWDQAHALAGLGRCDLAAGPPGDATAKLHDALMIFQQIGASEAAEVAAELQAFL